MDNKEIGTTRVSEPLLAEEKAGQINAREIQSERIFINKKKAPSLSFFLSWLGPIDGLSPFVMQKSE